VNAREPPIGAVTGAAECVGEDARSGLFWVCGAHLREVLTRRLSVAVHDTVAAPLARLGCQRGRPSS
jgi:hypothetical protein